MLANVFLDNGNGNEKAKSDTKEVIYPNRLKVYDENPLHTNLLSNSNKRETVYEVNGKKYVVDQNGMGSGSRNENRYETISSNNNLSPFTFDTLYCDPLTQSGIFLSELA